MFIYSDLSSGELSDVNLSTPLDNQVLKYDHSNSEFINGFISSVEISDMPTDLSNKANYLLSVNSNTVFCSVYLKPSSSRGGSIYC